MKDKLKAITNKVNKNHVIGVVLLGLAYLAGKEGQVVEALFNLLLP